MSEETCKPLNVDLSNQVAIVTGASQGLGKTCAMELARNGARVACLARNADKLAETVAAIEEAGGQASAFSVDVTDRESVDQTVDQIAEEWGSVDILVNNAGITRDALLPRMSDEDFDDVINTNLRGAFLFMRAVSKHMMSARYGRIINMSSVSGLIGNIGQTNYSASKAGLIGMTRSFSREISRRNVTVNCVAPGFIETDMTDDLDEKTKEAFLAGIPMKRLGATNEVADVCVFLGSDMSKYVSGQTISVCGALNT